MLTNVLLPFILSCNISAATELDLLASGQISKALKCAAIAGQTVQSESTATESTPAPQAAPKSVVQRQVSQN